MVGVSDWDGDNVVVVEGLVDAEAERVTDGEELGDANIVNEEVGLTVEVADNVGVSD